MAESKIEIKVEADVSQLEDAFDKATKAAIRLKEAMDEIGLIKRKWYQFWKPKYGVDFKTILSNLK